MRDILFASQIIRGALIRFAFRFLNIRTLLFLSKFAEQTGQFLKAS